MDFAHVLLCYVPSRDDSALLRQAAERSRAAGASLSLLLPVVDAAAPRACCGIGGEHWRQLLDHATRDDAARAASHLVDLGSAPANVTVDVGASLPELAASAAERFGCDAIFARRRRRPWSGGLTGRQLKGLHRGAAGRVVEI